MIQFIIQVIASADEVLWEGRSHHLPEQITRALVRRHRSGGKLKKPSWEWNIYRESRHNKFDILMKHETDLVPCLEGPTDG